MSEPKEGWCDLYVMQPAKDDNDPNAKELHLPNVQVVRGVNHFVGVVKSWCGGRKLRNLRIGSHGGPHSFRIGSDKITTATLGGFKNDLTKVKKYFERGFSSVTIDACNTGFDRGLVTRLSSLWGGVPIKSFLTWQYSEPEGSVDNGPYRTCSKVGKKTTCYTAMETGHPEVNDKSAAGKAMTEMAWMNYLLIKMLSDLRSSGQLVVKPDK